jgi:hypothetical protein
MRNRKVQILLICILLSSSTYAQKFTFNFHKIGEFQDRMGQTSLVDVDNDDDLDWVFGRFGQMYWYEYISADNWQLHDLGTGAKTDVGGCAHDVNGDGWVDFIVGDSWYENQGSPKSEKFILHKKNMIAAHDNVMVDINNDGIKDVVSVSNDADHPVFAWYKISKDYTDNWEYHKIGKGIHGGVSPHGFSDLDNDGDIDLICGDTWYENINGSGEEWKHHQILIPNGGNRPDKFGLAIKTWCFDLNKDGLMDIIQTEADTQDGRAFWWENYNNAEKFIFHLISADNTNQDLHSLALADIDNDGDVDIVSGGGPLSKGSHKLMIWENINGNGSEWTEHLIISDIRVHELVVGDVDKDGDIDICSKPWHGGLHFYLENLLIK